jgi:hypothetical protein
LTNERPAHGKKACSGGEQQESCQGRTDNLS